MSTLVVQVSPYNPGSVNARVWSYTSPGPDFNWNGVATSTDPINQAWNDLTPGWYAVTISWSGGYQNIGSGDGDGNNIIYDEASLYYQVVGDPSDGNSISATFSFQIT